MAKIKFIGKITDIVDATEEVRKAANFTVENLRGVNYIEINFSFTDDANIKHTGFTQLLFENNNYVKLSAKIPKKGSHISITKTKFILTFYKTDLGELNKYINLTRVSK